MWINTTATWSNTAASGSAVWISDEVAAATVNPWGNYEMDFREEGKEWTYRGSGKAKETIEVDKGSPAKARYAVFYAVKKDPVIFCRTRREMIKEVKKLLKREDVNPKSIRIFVLAGGFKKCLKKTG